MLTLHCDNDTGQKHQRLITDALIDLDERSSEFGFEGAGYLYSPRPREVGGSLERPTCLGMHSHVAPPWWQDAYLKKEMWRIDPVYQATLTTTLPVWWSYDARPRLVLDFRQNASTAQNRMFQHCFEATGIRSGLSVPMHSTLGGAVGYIVFSTRAPLETLQRNRRACEDTLLAIAHRFHHDVVPYLALTDERAARLSSRELDCLSLAAIGKTLEETALILSLSTSTVRFHLRNASRKLGAANRMQAVSKAAYLGLLGSIF
jgi:DNA-binding CsgD family transcriptional regulator